MPDDQEQQISEKQAQQIKDDKARKIIEAEEKEARKLRMAIGAFNEMHSVCADIPTKFMMYADIFEDINNDLDLSHDSVLQTFAN